MFIWHICFVLCFQIIHGLFNDTKTVVNRSLKRKYAYTEFQPFDKMEKELKRLSKLKNSLMMTSLKSIGKTFEGRDLWAVKEKGTSIDVEFKDQFGLKSSRKRKSIVVDCGAHAREWLAPATCMYLISEFSQVSNKFQSTPMYSALKQYNWIIIPTLNPDGYVYSWHNKTTRLWRKNRSFTKKQLKIEKKKQKDICRGVDINRNFGVAWGGVGAPADDPCYEMYAGDKPFSEKESQALANYLKSIKSDIKAYISLHCFGLRWMTPYGYKKSKPKDYQKMKMAADAAIEAIRQYSGVEYKFGTSYKQLYPNSGNSADWVYKKLHVPYSYMIEMFPDYDEDIDSEGFKQSSKDMIKNAQEITIGLTALSEILKINEPEVKAQGIF